MNNDLIVFMPSIEGGGVEKTYFTCNHLVRHVGSLKVVTISKFSNKFDKSIKVITFKSKNGTILVDE